VLPVNYEVVARIRGLEPNQAVLLGDANVVGNFNETARSHRLDKTGPRGRDFTLRMVWAADRKRALFCGANHGVPHRLNDVWEFDLAALTWVMLYAPDLPRDYAGLGPDYRDVVFRDGILYTQRGGPAVIAHTWWGLTYDPQRKMLLFMNPWVTDKKKMVEMLGGNPAELYPGPPMWGFSPEQGAWTMIKSEPPYPRPIFGGMLEYVPGLNRTLWHANNWQLRATWALNSETWSWENLHANPAGDFEQQAAQPEQVGYVDPKRKKLMVQRHKNTHHFDIENNTWANVISRGPEAADVPYGHDAHSPMVYDPGSGQGLLVEFKTNNLWAYEPDTPRWTRLEPTGDPMPTGNKRLAYFDLAMKVFIVIEDTKVWAYRYQ
jgi:hypothetical protein